MVVMRQTGRPAGPGGGARAPGSDRAASESALRALGPVFVLGCPRSGTTLLQLMLHAHPRIAIPPETRFLQAIYYTRAGFGDLRDPARRRDLAQFIVSRRSTLFGDLGLDARELVEEIVAAPPTLGSAAGTVFRAYARRFGKPRWGDKRPGYYQFIPPLLRMFPGAQIIHLVRDGRDCVASLKRMPWFDQGIYGAVATWMEAIGQAGNAERRLPQGTLLRVRYEDLVADPPRLLMAICAFLGEDYHPAMAAPHVIAGELIPARKAWHLGTRQPVTPARAGTWRSGLEPWEARLCEAVMGRRLRSLGYTLSGAGPAAPQHLARFAGVAARRLAADRDRGVRDWWQRAHDSQPLACLI